MKILGLITVIALFAMPAHAKECSFASRINFPINKKAVDGFSANTKALLEENLKDKNTKFDFFLRDPKLDPAKIKTADLSYNSKVRVIDHAAFTAFADYCKIADPAQSFNKFMNKEAVKENLSNEQAAYMVMMHLNVASYLDREFKDKGKCPAELEQTLQNYVKECE